MNDERLIWESYRKYITNDNSDILSFLNSILPNLAKAAEIEYNNWNQNEEGIDEELGGGGICDRIADSLSSTFEKLKPSNLVDWESFTMYKENECHTDMYIVNHKQRKIYEVGLPPYHYESGGGYTWKKKKEHTINPNSFHITDTYLDYENFFDEEGNMLDY